MDEISSKIISVIYEVYQKKQSTEFNISDNTSLRRELGFDSFDFAELAVKLEDIFGVDVFENHIVDSLSEIQTEIENGGK